MLPPTGSKLAAVELSIPTVELGGQGGRRGPKGVGMVPDANSCFWNEFPRNRKHQTSSFLLPASDSSGYPQYFLSRLRYCTASAMCSTPIESHAERSAMVRESLRTRSYALAERCRCSIACLSIDSAS